MKKQKTDKGFSLIELIIVIAIMAVLVVVCAPMYIKYIHKAGVARDWSNLKLYYDELQADYVSTGKYNANVKVLKYDGSDISIWKQREISSLDGNKIKMKAGYFVVSKSPSNNGYHLAYYCDKCDTDYEHHKDTCILVLGA